MKRIKIQIQVRNIFKDNNNKPKKRKNMDDEINDNYTTKNFWRKDINNILKEKVKTLDPIDINDIQIIKISKDGNWFYRCISFFLQEMKKIFKY